MCITRALKKITTRTPQGYITTTSNVSISIDGIQQKNTPLRNINVKLVYVTKRKFKSENEKCSRHTTSIHSVSWEKRYNEKITADAQLHNSLYTH
jgi:hypothetical protein